MSRKLGAFHGNNLPPQEENQIFQGLQRIGVERLAQINTKFPQKVFTKGNFPVKPAGHGELQVFIKSIAGLYPGKIQTAVNGHLDVDKVGKGGGHLLLLPEPLKPLFFAEAGAIAQKPIHTPSRPPIGAKIGVGCETIKYVLEPPPHAPV